MAVLNLPLTHWILLFTSISFIECQEIEPPTFVFEPPSNVYTFPGIEVTVDCLATGSPTPTIEWTIELGKQSAEAYVLRRVHPNGSATFDLSGLSMTKARCAARNGFGVVHSRIVSIKAVSFAEWSPILSVLSFVEEAFGIFECQVPRYMHDSVQRLFWWRTRKGGYFPEPLSGNFDVRYISVKEFLYIRNPVQEDTEFNFYCEAQMVISNETRRSEFVTPSFKGNKQNVSAPRVFTQWMRSSSSFQLGEIAVLVCPASGSPHPKFRWGLRSSNGPVEEILNSSRLSVNNGVIYFKPILLQDKGRYVCSAANSFGEDSTEINVVVNDRFFVTIYPNKKEVRDQQSVSFECHTSRPATNIFWIKNGETLKSERTVQINGTSLTIKMVTRTDVGVYQCVAEIDGTVEQATATLLLKDFPPEFESVFTNKLVHPGTSVSLKCSSTGSPSPEILWYFNDGPIEERFYNRFVIASFWNKSGIVTSYINITFAQIEDGGEYSCVAENGFGRKVHKAALNVLGRPATFSSIVNITAAYGRSLSIRCPISGYPVSNIRWSRSNNQLPRGSSAGDVLVFDNGTLIIQSVKKENHSGDFYCEGNDSIGATIKRRVAVIVSKPPEIAPFTFPPQMEIGTRLQVTCSVFSGDFPLTISWLKDGLPIPLDLRITEHNTPLASSLLFMEVRHSHAGAYTCKASNHAASAMFSAVLQVTVPPKWSLEPTNVEVVEHDKVQIACLAVGYPEPKVSWYKLVGDDTKTLINVLSLSESISILNNGSLLVSNVKEYDEGEYQCEVENGTKEKLIKRIRFNVRVPPSPLIVPKNVSVLVGKALTLFCDIRGDLPISISWTINGVSTAADKWKFRVSEVKINKKTRSMLSVISFNRDDAGLYLCLASNDLGRSAIPFYVKALALPGTPRSLLLQSRDSRSITLRWSTPFVSSEASDEYIIQWKIKETGLWVNDTSLFTNYTILNVIPATVYLVRVASSSSLGSSPFTEVLYVETLLEAPDSSPSNVQVSFTTENSFKLSWKPLANETDLKILGYIVSWAGTKDNVVLSLSVPADLTSTLIQNLEPSTYYKLSVAAFNSEGIGPNSSTHAMTFSTDEVPVVTDVSCSSINSQTLLVRWKAPEVYDGILSYRVYYRKVESKSGSDTKRSTSLETILHGLLPGTTFAVRVAVARRDDVGSASKAIYCTTNQEIPKKIKFFRVAPMSETEVLCVWSASKLTTSDVHYQIRYTEHGKDQDISLTIYPKPNEIEMSYHIPNLHPGLKYDFSVQVISSAGTSPKSSIVTVVPSSKARPKFLSTNHTVRAKALSMISLPCRASARETRGTNWFYDPGNLTIHNHRRISKNSADELLIRELLPEDSGNYTCITILDGIKHSVTHILEVLDIPKRPTLTLKLATEDSLTVSWTAEHGGNLAVTDFILAYREVGGLWEEREIEPSFAEYTLQRLRCGTAHEIKLSAVNDIGISQPSPLILAKTLGNLAKPPKPENMVYRLRNDPYLVLYNWEDGGCRVGRFLVKARRRYSTQWINLYDIRVPSSHYPLNTIPGTVSLWHLHPNQHDLLQIMAHSDSGIQTVEYEILFKENITSGLALLSNTANSGSTFSDIEQSFNLQILIPVLSGIVTTIACTSLCVMIVYLRKMRNLKNSSSSRTVSNVNIHESSNANPIYQRAGTSEADLSSRSLDNHLEDYDINPYATFNLADVKGHWYDLHQDSGTISTAVTATLEGEYGLAKDTIRSNPPPYRTIASYGAASFDNDDHLRYFKPVSSERRCEAREEDIYKESISVISPPSFHNKHLFTISKDNDTDSSETRTKRFYLPKKSGRLKQWKNVTEEEEYSINV